MLKKSSAILTLLGVASLAATAATAFAADSDETEGCPPAEIVSCVGAGPQSGRDIDEPEGANPIRFEKAPPFAGMSLCDVHFHRSAEHRAHAYDTPASDDAGFVCPQWRLAGAGERASRDGCDGVELGDTIEVHWVYTTCDVDPAPCLTSCVTDDCQSPLLRVEAQVFFLTPRDYDFQLQRVWDGGPRWRWSGPDDWFHAGYDRAPPPAARAVEYPGSTTGSSYNEEDACSPFEVTWSVRRDCRALSLPSLDAWCADNVFNEDGAHGVRGLVDDLKLLSKIP